MGQMYAHSKWIEAHIMSNITATTTIDKLGQVFAVHGLPDTLVTGNGTTFTSELFGEFTQQKGIHHIKTAPFHPASNGLAERAVQTVKESLKRMTGTFLAPSFHVFCLSTCSHCRPPRVKEKQKDQKKRHDQHAQVRPLSPGDNVYVRNFSISNHQKWLPGIILKQSEPVSYVVELSDGRVFRRHQDHVRLRQDAGPESNTSTDFPVMEPMTVQECPTAQDPQAPVPVSNRGGGQRHSDIQPPPTPADPPSIPEAHSSKEHTPSLSTSSPAVVRRSQT